jgi:Fe-S-cluster containining protein
VRVSDEEARVLARHLGLELADFRLRFTRRLDDGTTSLTEKPNLECVFWSRESGCTVHPVRPTQCRTWPFWRANLASPAHWAAAAHDCPGMDQGTLHEAALIRAQAEQDGTSGRVPDIHTP